MMKTRVLAWIALACLAACSSDSTADAPASADAKPATADASGSAKTFNVSLSPSGEPTACAGAASGATGSATVTISADGSQIMVSNLTYSGLSGTANSAHIHFGTATTPSGPVVLNFGTGSALTSPINKTFTSSDYQAAGGAPSSFSDFVTMAKAGNNAYINIHTTACPGGEIRGELQ